MTKWQRPAIFEIIVKMQRLRTKVEKLKLQSKMDKAQRMLLHQVKKANIEP